MDQGKSYNQIAKELKILTDKYIPLNKQILRDIPDGEYIAKAEQWAINDINKRKIEYNCNTLDELIEALKKTCLNSNKII